jgi:DNA-binding response OmpR family regulator
MLRTAVGGDIVIDYAPAGLFWRLSCPQQRVLDKASRPAAAEPRAAAPIARPGCRDAWQVLVVEDEALIAAEIVAVLSEAGFDVLRPAGTVGQAIDLINHNRVYAAVLDVNLGSETSETVAQRFVSPGTVVVTVLGYTRGQMPDVFRALPNLGKPLRPSRLLTEMRALAAGGKPIQALIMRTALLAATAYRASSCRLRTVWRRTEPYTSKNFRLSAVFYAVAGSKGPLCGQLRSCSSARDSAAARTAPRSGSGMVRPRSVPYCWRWIATAVLR